MVDELRKRRMPIMVSLFIISFWCIGMFFILKDEMRKSHMIKIETYTNEYYTSKVDTIENGIEFKSVYGRHIKIRGDYTLVIPKEK